MRGWFIFLGLLFFAPAVQAQVLWEGNFETNDFSEYGGRLNAVVDGKPYIEIVEDVVSKGTYAVRIELHDDARWPNGLRRVELQHAPAGDGTAEGKTTYYAWSFYVPETLSEDPSQQIGYWESKNSYRQMMAFTLRGNTLSFATRQPQNVIQWTGEGVVTPATWHRIAMRIKWSKEVDIGEVDIWFDGGKVVDAAKAKTLNDDNGHFAQFGLLRGDADFGDVPVIYIDDAVEGLTLEDIRIDAHLKPTLMDDEGVKDMGNVATDMASRDMTVPEITDMRTADIAKGSDTRRENDTSTPKNKGNEITGTGGCATSGNSSSMLFLFFGFFLITRSKRKKRMA